MAELTPKPISELTEATTLTDSDIFATSHVVSNAYKSRKITWANIKSQILSWLASSPLPIANGGTGSTSATAAMTALGNADYVVEQGTSGIWTWRKWASGIAECWGTQTATGVSITSVWGSLYYSSSISATLPSGLFDSVATCQCSVDPVDSTKSDVLYCADASTKLSTTRTNGIFLIRPDDDSTNKSYKIYWEVKGRWTA